MGRIIDITPRTNDVSPVLMILTSHRVDCFLLCVKCLEIYTDLSRFKKIYVLANDVSDEHAVIIKSFQRRHANVIDIHLTPRGMVPAVLSMQNFIMARHHEDPIVRLDEDVFVTPHWLDHLLASYKVHRGHEQVALVSCLTPVSRTGRQCLSRLFRAHYGDERRRLPETPVENNPVYHRFIWEKVLEDGLDEKWQAMERPRHYYLGAVSDRLVMFDSRLMDLILPMQLKTVDGVPRMDEFYINAALRLHGLKAAVNSSALVHHFAHARAEEYLRSHVSLDDVWWYMTGLGEPRSGPGIVQGPRFRPGRTRDAARIMRQRNWRVIG